MTDATPVVAPPPDTIVGVDFDWIHICPKDKIITYTLADVWQSGKIVVRPQVTVKDSDFAACAAAFMQAMPRKKLLTWLTANGYEANLTVA